LDDDACAAWAADVVRLGPVADWRPVRGVAIRSWYLPSAEASGAQRLAVLVRAESDVLDGGRPLVTPGLGALAGGVAHEFNNVLAAVLGNLDLAQVELEPDDPLQLRLTRMQGGLERARALVCQLLAYSGDLRTELRPVDVHAAYRSAAKSLRVAVPRHVGLELDLADGLPLVMADEGQLQLALLHLVRNAAEAIGAGPGTVVLRTRYALVGSGSAGVGDVELPPGRYVVIDVDDDGPGVAAWIRDRMFEPFVTTRGTGRGLGLSAVGGVAKAHGGAVRVHPLNPGVRFSLYLPAAGVPRRAPELTPHRVAPVPGGGRILVVDDEPLVHDVLPSMLQAIGLDADGVTSGEDALVRLRTDPSRYRLVLLDLVMPGMGGLTAREIIRASWPELPVLVCSGYHEDAVSVDGWVLTKPFHLAALRDAIAVALGVAD
jgi:signal transduction histidine kinase/CheY-like chemotaxis protein